MVTRRRIEPRRRAEPPSNARGGSRRRRRRGPSRLVAAGIAGAAAVALTVGLGVTYVAGADDAAAPTRLDFDPVSPTSATLSWRTTGADEYVVSVGSDRALTSARTAKVPGEKSSLTLDDLAATNPGADQYFRVDAIEDGKTVSSRTARFVLQPGPVTDLKVPKVAANGFRADWKEAANARQYDVQVATDDAFEQRIASVRTLRPAASITMRGMEAGTAYFVRVRPVNQELVGAWTEPATFKTAVPSVKFRVATWNVCSEACSGYGSRGPIMADFLNSEQVDLFGVQEAGGQRVGPRTNAIFSGGKRGFKLASGGGESRYIFYRPALFTQKSGGLIALGNGRYATWARFATKESGRQFYVVNLHLITGNGADGKRRSQMNTLVGRMRSVNTDGLPIVYLGDFNSGVHRSRDSPGAIMRSVGMTDTVRVAKEALNTEINSGHTFSTKVRYSGDYVDHIFVSKQFQVAQWKQLVRLNGRSYARPVVSDHNAISAVLALDSLNTDIGAVTPTTTLSGLSADPLG